MRNNEVCNFRVSVLNHISSVLKKKIDEGTITTGEEIDRVYRIFDAYSYKKMLHSFKPLKVECWFTEEELKIMGYESK